MGELECYKISALVYFNCFYHTDTKDEFVSLKLGLVLNQFRAITFLINRTANTDPEAYYYTTQTHEPCFMPLSIFHLNSFLMLMIKINKKQVLFYKIRSEGCSNLIPELV